MSEPRSEQPAIDAVEAAARRAAEAVQAASGLAAAVGATSAGSPAAPGAAEVARAGSALPPSTPPPGPATRAIYLKLDGIMGASEARGHVGEIDLLGFAWGTKDAVTIRFGGGASVTRAAPIDLQFLARTSVASPLLMVATASGRHIANAVVSVVRPGVNPRLEYRLRFEAVIISSYENYTDHADVQPLDLVRIGFGKVTFDYFPQRSDGSIGPATTTSWNFATNSPT